MTKTFDQRWQSMLQELNTELAKVPEGFSHYIHWGADGPEVTCWLGEEPKPIVLPTVAPAYNTLDPQKISLEAPTRNPTKPVSFSIKYGGKSERNGAAPKCPCMGAGVIAVSFTSTAGGTPVFSATLLMKDHLGDVENEAHRSCKSETCDAHSVDLCTCCYVALTCAQHW